MLEKLSSEIRHIIESAEKCYLFDLAGAVLKQCRRLFATAVIEIFRHRTIESLPEDPSQIIGIAAQAAGNIRSTQRRSKIKVDDPFRFICQIGSNGSFTGRHSVVPGFIQQYFHQQIFH